MPPKRLYSGVDKLLASLPLLSQSIRQGSDFLASLPATTVGKGIEAGFNALPDQGKLGILSTLSNAMEAGRKLRQAPGVKQALDQRDQNVAAFKKSGGRSISMNDNPLFQLTDGPAQASAYSLGAHLPKLLRYIEEHPGTNISSADAEAYFGKLGRLAEIYKRGDKSGLNTPIQQGQKPLTRNEFERSACFELNGNCNKRSSFASTADKINEQLASRIDEINRAITANGANAGVEAIARRAPHMSSDDLLAMGDYYKSLGMTAPCTACYVEAGRRRRADVMGTFMDKTGTGGFTDRSKYPARAEVLKTYGDIPKDLLTNPQAYSDNPLMMKLISEAGKYAGGAVKAKRVDVTNADYKGNLLNIAGNKNTAAGPGGTNRDWWLMNDGRGVRASGSTDITPDGIIDALQFNADAAAVGVPIYTYTKNQELVPIMAPAGWGVNQSAFINLDEGQSLAQATPDTWNGIKDWDLAQRYMAKWPRNVGMSLTALNDNQVLWGLENPLISNITAGHHSGWTKEQVAQAQMRNYPSDASVKKYFGSHPNFWKLKNHLVNPDQAKPVNLNPDFKAASQWLKDYYASGGYPAQMAPNDDIVNMAIENVKAGLPMFPPAKVNQHLLSPSDRLKFLTDNGLLTITPKKPKGSK